MILKTVPWCWGNCSQDFDHWKLAVLCKLLHTQWRCFTAVRKIKVDIGLTSLISAKNKKHVRCAKFPYWDQEKLHWYSYFLLFCLLPVCYRIIQNIHWVCTDYRVSYGVYLLWSLLHFLMLALWTHIYRKERSFCTSAKFTFVKRLFWGCEQDHDDVGVSGTVLQCWSLYI